MSIAWSRFSRRWTRPVTCTTDSGVSVSQVACRALAGLAGIRAAVAPVRSRTSMAMPSILEPSTKPTSVTRWPSSVSRSSLQVCVRYRFDSLMEVSSVQPEGRRIAAQVAPRSLA